MAKQFNSFCRSGFGGYIESPFGARGCDLGCFVGGTIGKDSNNLWSLNPETGEELWGAAVGTAINNIFISATGRLYVAGGLTLYEIDKTNGDVLRTRGVLSQSADSFDNGDIILYENPSGNLVRCDGNLENDVWSKAPTNGLSDLMVGGDGDIYCVRGGGVSPGFFKHDGSDGTELASDDLPSQGSYSLIAPPGNHWYATNSYSVVVGPDVIIKNETSKRLKSDCTEVSSLTWEDINTTTDPVESFLTTRDTTDFNLTHFFTAQEDLKGNASVRKFKFTSFTQTDSYDTGSSAQGCFCVGDLVIIQGARSSTWDGNDGTNKSVWALNQDDLSIAWTFDTQGTAICGAGEYRQR